jgi:asparagine synthase (glutamine-hydrolysing)
MLDAILTKVDRASMYNSLEVRAPFLDYELAEFALSLPSAYKMHGFTMKYILKELMKDKLPREIVFRPKKGFGIPLTGWLKRELQPLADSLLSKEKLGRQGLFNYDYTARLRTEHSQGLRDNRKELWTLMVFQMWYDRWYT